MFSYDVIFGDQMICTIEFFISFVVVVVVVVVVDVVVILLL